MDDLRNKNGVRVRVDGGGDGWANDHRSLPRNHYLSDCDAFVGMVAFGKNGGDTLFLEFAPDAYANAGKLIREFGLVAIFERKRTFEAANLFGSVLSAGLYLHFCRTYAKFQPIAPRFFFVFGADRPYRLQEIGIVDGLPVGNEVSLPVASNGWVDVWKHLGLTQAHRLLEGWLSERIPRT